MSWMNEHEIEESVRRFSDCWPEVPNLVKGAEALEALKNWTNRNSDGWPYWVKPQNAAKRLTTLLGARMTSYWRGEEIEDCTEAELAAALRPIKAFLTRQKVEHSEVLS